MLKLLMIIALLAGCAAAAHTENQPPAVEEMLPFEQTISLQAYTQIGIMQHFKSFLKKAEKCSDVKVVSYSFSYQPNEVFSYHVTIICHVREVDYSIMKMQAMNE